jgi:CRP-like cAMP-binding protein
VEPALGERLCAEEFRAARETCTAAVVGLRPGKMVAGRSHNPLAAADTPFLVIRGLLTRRVLVSDRSGAELLGRGDVVYPPPSLDERLVLSATSWRVDEPCLLAVLDERFQRCAARWPQVTMALNERSVLRSHSLLLRLAIVEHPQIARRVHLLLWHLADRWGSADGEGVVLPLKLSRVALADLVSSTRESVSRSLTDLERQDLVRRRNGGYFLPFPSPAQMQDVTAVTNGNGGT